MSSRIAVPTQADAIDKVVKLLKNRRAIAFLGAGASASSGYPTWEGLLSQLHAALSAEYSDTDGPKLGSKEFMILDKLAKESSNSWSDPLVRAEIYKQHLGEHYESCLKNIFKCNGKPASALYLTLLKLGFKHYVTTNWERALCKGFEESNVQYREIEWSQSQAICDFLYNLPHLDTHIIYLHGRIDDIGTVIFTETDYINRYILNDDAAKKLFTLFLTQPVVFIGFSLKDPDLVSLLRVVNAYARPDRSDISNLRHFAILSRSEDQDPDLLTYHYWHKYGVVPIFYLQDEKHTGLQNLLKFLEGAVQDKPPEQKSETNAQPVIGQQTRNVPGYALSTLNIDLPQEDIRLLEGFPTPGARVFNDPNKNRFSGRSSTSGLILEATVSSQSTPARSGTPYYTIRITLSADTNDFEGASVEIHLHDTFKNPIRTLPILNRQAVLECRAYGAFTVGAVVTKKNSSQKFFLELDLATIPGIPDVFRLG